MQDATGASRHTVDLPDDGCWDLDIGEDDSVVALLDLAREFSVSREAIKYTAKRLGGTIGYSRRLAVVEKAVAEDVRRYYRTRDESLGIVFLVDLAHSLGRKPHTVKQAAMRLGCRLEIRRKLGMVRNDSQRAWATDETGKDKLEEWSRGKTVSTKVNHIGQQRDVAREWERAVRVLESQNWVSFNSMEKEVDKDKELLMRWARRLGLLVVQREIAFASGGQQIAWVTNQEGAEKLRDYSCALREFKAPNQWADFTKQWTTGVLMIQSRDWISFACLERELHKRKKSLKNLARRLDLLVEERKIVGISGGMQLAWVTDSLGAETLRKWYAG